MVTRYRLDSQEEFREKMREIRVKTREIISLSFPVSGSRLPVTSFPVTSVTSGDVIFGDATSSYVISGGITAPHCSPLLPLK
jgi:hypothetical protein